MAIYRGIGGAGEANNDATLNAVTEKAQDAAESATEAATSATAAANSATAAATSATNAASSESSVAANASAAASSASSAASSATTASTAATNAGTAQTAAETAQAAAEAAQTAAETAETNAETAETNAASSASSAASSATTATTKASEASTSATNAANSATAAAGSATAAAASETAAAASETAAAASATSASGSATTATTKASEASTSATNAATSATTATTKASEAASSATSASGSATTATTKASEASTSASNAATSATAASGSETAAASSATAAAASETAAAASETAAATSATNAASSETAASTSAGVAALNATSAASSATSAANSATAAATSATNAASSETAAASSESAAATSETNAATSASTATTKASEAATSATNAASSASAAATSASNASASADAALAALDSFDDRYLGQKASAPTVDNDGDALVAGALYFNTTSDEMKVYDGSQWLNAYASLSGALLATNNLSDLTNAATARTNLGLGTAATTASTDYATAAQGALADSAVQPADNVSDLTNDAGYITDYTVTEGDVTAHQAALSITESQISDLGSYITGNQTITLSGDVSGSGTTSISVTVADDSHNHVISNVDGLQTALDGKQPLSTVLTNTTASFTTADETKLDGIESGATADQSAAEILTAIKTVDGSGSGLDADTVDGIQASSFLRSDTNDSTSGYLQAEGFVASGGTGTHILAPHGAHYATSSSSITGAIKVTLPQSWTNTMLRFTVKVFEYTTGESFDIVCAGYNYTGGGGSWANTTAYILSDPHKNRNFTVRFGHDGSKCCVYIGETSSTWAYPQVAVTEFYAGYSSTAAENWNDNWSISFATSLGTISSTHSNNEVGRYVDGNTVWHTGNDGSGSGLDADNLDGRTWSTTRNSANTLVTRDGSGYTQLGWINTTSGETTNTITKIYGTYGTDSWIRYFTPATLISQQGIWTSSNDGSGSGLDADTVDGQHASAFAAASHTHSYLPLSGGTLTGTVNAPIVNITDEITLEGAAGSDAKIQKNATALRDELQIYAGGDAYSTGSAGAGIHLYGNNDDQHAGNIAFLTGQSGQGDGRMIISGGSDLPASDGYRTNTDTRVTIGNDIWNWVDDGNDTGMLNLKNPDGRPALYITDTSASEGEIAVPSAEAFNIGQWDGSTFSSKLEIDGSGNLLVGRTSIFSSGSHAIQSGDTATLDIYCQSTVGGRNIVNIRSNVGGTADICAAIEANGDFLSDSNSYGSNSDIRLKQDIVDANSQIDDIKAIKFKNYRLIKQVDALGDEAPTMLGVIAQDLEESGMSGLVAEGETTYWTQEDAESEEGLPEGVSVGDIKEQGYKAVKYSVLYMKAVKALQEAIDEIESLKARVAALEN
jgi:hypothetical protein